MQERRASGWEILFANMNTGGVCSTLDSFGVCYFISDWMNPVLSSFVDFSNALSFVTNMNMEPKELILTDERIYTLVKMLNIVYAGFQCIDDYPPKHLIQTAIETKQVAYCTRKSGKCCWAGSTSCTTEVFVPDTPHRLQELGLEVYNCIIRGKGVDFAPCHKRRRKCERASCSR